MGDANEGEADGHSAERAGREAGSAGDRSGEEESGMAEWFAVTTLRVGLTLVGLLLLLFALGQAFAIDLIGLVVAALADPTAQWLVIALFGLAIIFVAQRAFR